MRDAAHLNAIRASVLPLLIACVALRAQAPWIADVSPTRQTLWGVCANAGAFVAVGEGGAIITTAAGFDRWTPTLSNTTRWLLAVTWSPELNLYVVVGDAGTILTSPDALSGWTSRNSGTAQRLNSIAWGGGAFLVTGENGTALTSPDGVTWTPRTTGDTGWLRGLTYGNGLFVATGHDGTILTTADRGTTFQRRIIATSAHLDAAIFAGDRFYVTGSDFVLGSSPDGTTWSLNSSVNADGRENGIVYNGLVYFNNTLLAVGDGGRIRDQFGGTWNSRAITTNWRAVAANASRIYAVGTEGQIALTYIGSSGYRISLTGVPYVGHRVTLHADIFGQPATPFGSQWTLDGKPIAGATGDTLVLDSATPADSGTYRYTSAVANATITGDYALTIEPGPNAVGLVDTTFKPALTDRVDAIAPLPDGRLYVAGAGLTFAVAGRTQHGLARLNSNGAIDPSFNPGDGLTLGLNVPFLFLQPDGRLVVWVRLTRLDGTFYTPLARFNADGSSDNSFQPAPALHDTLTLPILLSDGRWLVATPRTDAAGNRTVGLSRFSASGGADPNFGIPSLAPPFSATVDQSAPAMLSTIDAQGRVYLASHYGFKGYIANLSAASDSTVLFRLNADGTPDLGFAARGFGSLDSVQATPQGILAQQTVWAWGRPSYQKWTGTTFRLKFDGTDDPSFRPIITEIGPSGLSPGTASYGYVAALPDGSFIASTLTARGHSGLVHFSASGEFDPNFSATLGHDTYFINQCLPLANGQLLVRGSFTTIQGEPQPYLARLTPDTRAAATRLANISVRARAGSGANTLILGFVTTGGAASVLARGSGPALAAFGVPGFLADPQLGLFSGNTQIAGNDDWGAGPAALLAATAIQLGAFPFQGGSRDAALYATSPPGAYTVQLTGKNSATGVALAEVYDASARPTDFTSPRVVNFSVRTTAGNGADTLIAGFAIDGTASRQLLLRAVGAGLRPFGINDFVLPAMVLTIYRDSAPIASSANWAAPGFYDNFLAAEATRAVGAFPIDVPNGDIAMVVSLSPGLYTAHVTSASGMTGVVLVEIYEIP